MEEVNVVNNVLERAFNISPTTIYGFVVGLLFVLLVMQLIAIRKKDKQIITLYEKMVKLEQETLNANEIDLADKRKKIIKRNQYVKRKPTGSGSSE